MRYYDLSIGGVYNFSSKPSFMSLTEKVPLHIEFDIQMFNDPPQASIGFVRLYNIDVDFFVQSQMLIGEPVILKAGWRDSVYTKRLKWKNITSDVLVNAYIMNTLADFSGTNPYIDIFFTPIPNPDLTMAQALAKQKQMEYMLALGADSTKQKKTKAKKIKVTESFADAVTKQMGEIKVIANKGEKIFDKIRQALRKAVPAIKVKAYDKKIKSLTSPSDQPLYAAANTVFEFIERVKLAIQHTEIHFFIDAKKGEIALYTDLSKPEDDQKFVIQRSEMVSQPQFVGVAGEMTLSIRMRPDLSIGNVIKLEGTFPNLSSFNANGMLPAMTDPRTTFQTGEYVIIQMSHKGSFYSTNATDWATNLTLTPKNSGAFRRGK